MVKKGKTGTKAQKNAKKAAVVETSPVSKINLKSSTIEKAISALSKWNAQKNESADKQNLLEEDDDELPLILQVSSIKFFSDNKVLHVEQLLLPHSINSEDTKVCVITKDGFITPEQLEQIEELPNFGKLITVKDLKTTYKPYQSRRKLLSEFDVFFVDAMVVSLMPKLLGKIFYQSPKLPLSVKFATERKFDLDLFTKSYNDALSSVGCILPMGNNMVIRMGVLGQEPSHLVENLQSIAEYLSKFQIRALQLKLCDSPSLPIYTVDKIFTAEDVAAEGDFESKEAEKTANQAKRAEEKRIFEDGLKELGLDIEEEGEETKKRTLEKEEDESKSTKKSKKN